MKTISLHKAKLTFSRLGFGCWRVAGNWEHGDMTPERRENGRQAILAAFDAGYTFFDHADIYGNGQAESLFGEVLKEISGARERIVLASKCGIRRAGDPKPESSYRYDFSADHILRACEGSLRRLGVEILDLYMLHRADYLMDPQEVAEAFSKLKKSGKVKEFGVSNFNPSQFNLLQKACPMPMVVNQVEISLSQLNCFTNGVLDQCLLEQTLPLAWSPLAGGRLVSGAPIDLHAPDHARRIKLREILDNVARERGVTRTTIALSWLLKHPSRIVPIVGSTNPAHIKDAINATEIELTRDEWYRLTEAALGQRLP